MHLVLVPRIFFNGGGGESAPPVPFGLPQAKNVSENISFNSDLVTPRWVCPSPQDFAGPRFSPLKKNPTCAPPPKKKKKRTLNIESVQDKNYLI